MLISHQWSRNELMGNNFWNDDQIGFIQVCKGKHPNAGEVNPKTGKKITKKLIPKMIDPWTKECWEGDKMDKIPIDCITHLWFAWKRAEKWSWFTSVSDRKDCFQTAEEISKLWDAQYHDEVAELKKKRWWMDRQKWAYVLKKWHKEAIWVKDEI